MRQIGSQRRETLAEAGYELVVMTDNGQTAILFDGMKLEVWTNRNDYAGYVIEIDGIGFEFVRSALDSDIPDDTHDEGGYSGDGPQRQSLACFT